MRSISIFFSVVMVFLSGCASMFYASTQMPVQGKEELAKIKNPALVKIEREDNMWGGAIPFVIYDGKKEIGRLGPSGSFEWKREAGYLKLTITGAVRTIVGPNLPDEAIYEDYQETGETLSFISGLNVDRKIAIWIKPQQKQAPQDILAFGRAEDSNTINAYDEFMKTYAKSSRVDEAIRRCENLIEEAGILNIYNLNNQNIDILKAYLNALPKGKYAQFAEEVNQYYEAEKRPSKKAFEDYLQKWPNGQFEKWAKDNLTFTSFGEATDQSLIETQEAAGQIARYGILTTLQSLKQNGTLPVFPNSSGLSVVGTSKGGYMQLNKLGKIGDQAVWIKGTLGCSSDGADNYSFYYNGNASNEISGGSFKSKFILMYDVLARPLRIDSSKISLSEKSWIVVEGKQYYYNGRHWANGLNNPFFSIDSRMKGE